MQVNLEGLDPDKAFIQITHVIPYFDAKELTLRRTKFEREDRISKFLFETPFNTAGKTHGPTANQWMRKTILTSEPQGGRKKELVEKMCAFGSHLFAIII